MAQYQHLPIYKATYELLGKITAATAGFSKSYKYSPGDKLRSEVVEMVVFIFKANSSRTERAHHAGLCRARASVNDVRQAAHSYFGIFNHANAWKLQGRLAAGLHKAGYGSAVPSHLQDARFPR